MGTPIFDNGQPRQMQWLGPAYQPLPTLYLDETWPETSQQPHHTQITSLRHKFGRWFHDHDTEQHIPVTDVRETPTDYFIDVELPGIADKSKVQIHWNSTRTLFLEARIDRPHIADCTEGNCVCNGKSALKPSTIDEHKATSGATKESPAVAKESKSEGQKSFPHLTVNERPIGYFARNFNFPVDVNYERIKASLEYGLLKLQVTKRPHETVAKKGNTIDWHGE